MKLSNITIIGAAGLFGFIQCQNNFLTEIVNELNAERSKRGLYQINISKKLTKVAQAHVDDLSKYADSKPGLHDWPSVFKCKISEGYKCMWDKPRQLTGYSGNGYEVSFLGLTKPKDLIRGWLNSKPHAEVLLNQGSWHDNKWEAVGAATRGQYSVMWFGEVSDKS
ncbi:hypothetical protein K502DRAFT_11039 [Neoconidiobolus thromboides FSU 785]|nr:hypothetical protein K502DRAFT_11039 [Neoconidiobolus thromboides FSU 785]